MNYETLRYDVDAGIATLTLNRPDASNALNIALGRDLLHAAIEADEDRAVRCIVLTGAGKAFCSGGDIKDFTDGIDRIGVHIKRLTTDFHGAISRLANSGRQLLTCSSSASKPYSRPPSTRHGREPNDSSRPRKSASRVISARRAVPRAASSAAMAWREPFHMR